MVFVAAITCVSFLTWLLRAISFSDRKTYIKNHVQAGGVYTGKNKENRLHKFVAEYMRLDGVFIMRLIGHNTNNITVTEITTKLWLFWNKLEDDKENKNNPKKIEDDNNDNPDDDTNSEAGSLPEKSATAPPMDIDDVDNSHKPLIH